MSAELASFVFAGINPQSLLGAVATEPELVDSLEEEYLKLALEQGGMEGILNETLIRFNDQVGNLVHLH